MLLVIGVMIGLSNYFTYLKTGKGLFNANTLSMPDISLDTRSIKDLLSADKEPQESNDVLHKWVDSNGVTQYTQTRPPKHAIGKVILVDPNANVVARLKTNAKTPEKAPQADDPEGSAYNPSTVKKLMDDAKNVQKLLDDRAAKHTEIIDGL